MFCKKNNVKHIKINKNENEKNHIAATSLYDFFRMQRTNKKGK
jgi:hypothetical protein